VRKPERRLLREVGDVEPERRPVPHRGAYLLGGLADDDADLGDAGIADRTQDVEQDRLVRDRDQLLGVRVGEGPQP
jgi:hypothetical protein